MEEEECGAALAVLQDVVQLCELMRGETESCSFNSICSDCFTGIAMKHLCAPDPGKSTPCRILLPFIEQTLLGIGGGNGDHLNQNDRNEVAQTAAAAAAATEAAKLSMALAEERSLGMAELQARLDEQAKTLAAKSAEAQALSAKNAALARALEEKPLAKAQSAGQELVQSGVQMIPSSELDLDLTNKALLGSGVYSEVYQTVRQVALKALRGRFNQQRFREFKQEAEILQLVQGSSGVCRLHGICIDSLPNLYLITEPVFGGTLEAYLQTTQSKGVPMERAIPLARSIASAMKDVHAKGVVHRDLKPSNCILTKYDNTAIKLVDFGLARLVQGDFIPSEEHDGAGTPMYQAPEVLQNSGVGLASDVFAFGIIMWEIISGDIPYEGLSLSDMKLAVMAGARPPIKAGWGKEWVDMMRGCWSADSSKRPSFQMLQDTLTRMLPKAAATGAPILIPDASMVQQMVLQAASAGAAASSPLFHQHEHARSPPGAQFSSGMSSPRGMQGGGGMGAGGMQAGMLSPPHYPAHYPAMSSPGVRGLQQQHMQQKHMAMRQQHTHHMQQQPNMQNHHPHRHPQHQQQQQQQMTQQVAGGKISPGTQLKTMAGSQFGGIVQDMEEM